jgi:hypothetical protein
MRYYARCDTGVYQSARTEASCEQPGGEEVTGDFFGQGKKDERADGATAAAAGGGGGLGLLRGRRRLPSKVFT